VDEYKGFFLVSTKLEVRIMIISHISSKEMYQSVHPKMKRAFDFLEKYFDAPMEPGRYDIDGENLYAIIFRYVPQKKENLHYETHNQYIDIQCMAKGSEYQWYMPRKDLAGDMTYNPEKDITFYPFEEKGSRLRMGAGDFAIYFPADGHLPAMTDGTKDECVRIVVKIKC